MLSEQKKQAKSIGMIAGMTEEMSVEVTTGTDVEMIAEIIGEGTAGTTVVIILIILDEIDTKDRVRRTTGMGIIILEIIQKMIGSAANVKT